LFQKESSVFFFLIWLDLSDWPIWEDELRWWTNTSNEGFIMLKMAGNPTKEPITPAEIMTPHWFR